MPKKIDVYGLTDEELSALRELAAEKYGKASVSLLAKKLLLAQLEEKANPTIDTFPSVAGRKRITLRLPERDRAYLTAVAEQNHSSINDAARDILQAHIHRTPFLADNEVQALYQSNYQLLRIGRNLNQIARQLNAGESAVITTQHIQELKAVIDAHTDRVNNVLSTNRKRFEK